jgi:hypothetical protein
MFLPLAMPMISNFLLSLKVLTIATGFRVIWTTCRSGKFGLNATKCKSISFNRNKKPIGFDYRIEGHEFEHFEETKDFGGILDTRISFLSHVETTIFKSASMLAYSTQQDNEPTASI